MPIALAPSNVFPSGPTAPITTEARARYVDFQAAATAAPRPYRGVLDPIAGGVVNPLSIVESLESLGARLEALRAKPAPAPAPAPAPPAEKGAPWENPTYDTFAKYAGEASRVAASGRLPFGSDNKKMAL